MRRLKVIFLITLVGILATGAEREALTSLSPRKDKLIWQAEYTYQTNSNDTAFGFYNYRLDSLALYEGSNLKWRILLPERIRRDGGGSIYDKISDPQQPSGYRKASPEEVDVNLRKEFLRCPELIASDVIAITDVSGFLLIDRKNGSTVLDVSRDTARSEFYVDEGMFSIRSRNVQCSDSLTHGAEFNIQCGKNLVVFDGSRLLVIRNRKLRHDVSYVANRHLIRPGLTREVFFTVDDIAVRISGRIFVR